MVLFHTAAATVQNLRFSDTDTDSGELGGYVRWEADPSPPAGLTHYRVFLATASDGTGTNTQVQTDVTAGAYSSVLDMTANTAKGSNNYLLVYEVISGLLKNIASIYVFDNPTNFVTTMYLTTLGYTKASNAKAALVTGNHAAKADITVQQVVTLKWDGSSAVTETAFDDAAPDTSETAAWAVIFQTSSTKSTVDTAMASYVTSAPLDLFATGTGSDSTYSLGTLQVTSKFGAQVALPSDTDGDVPEPITAQYMARSLIDYSLAYAAMITRNGDMYVQTAATAQIGANGIANVWMGWPTTGTQFTFVDMSADTAITTRVGSTTTGQCWQISNDHLQPDCTIPV